MKASFDPNVQLLAAQYLRKQCKQLSGQVNGIRQGTDVEFVHRARVATRRLRAALRIFADCFPQADVERWQKQVRKVTRGLGAARDLDVQREYLAGVLARLEEPADHVGIARLLVRTELARDKLHRNVLKAVDRFQRSRAIEQMLASVKAVLKDSDDDEVCVSSPSVVEKAAEHITVRLDEMLVYQASLDDPLDQQQHHAMRIAAKRLRYTIEVFKPAYEGHLDGCLAIVKQLQTLLGDLHDCDVWIEQLPAMLDDERRRIVRRYGHAGPLERLEPGIRRLQAERQRQREELFEQLRKFWQEQTRQGTWESIAQTARGRVESLSSAPQEATLRQALPEEVRLPIAAGNPNGDGLSQQGVSHPDAPAEKLVQAAGPSSLEG